MRTIARKLEPAELDSHASRIAGKRFHPRKRGTIWYDNPDAISRIHRGQRTKNRHTRHMQNATGKVRKKKSSGVSSDAPLASRIVTNIELRRLGRWK